MFRRVEGRMAARVVRAYRTVSHVAGTVLAGWPLLEFLAQMYAEVYQQERELRGEARIPLRPRTKKTIWLHARQSMIERWDAHLSDPNSGSKDFRGHPVLSSKMAGQGSGGDHVSADAGAHRA